MIDASLGSQPIEEQFAEFISNSLYLIDTEDHKNNNNAHPLDEINQAILDRKYSRAILLLDSYIDFKQKIKWHFPGEFRQHAVLLRDARGCNAPNQFDPEHYTKMGLNAVLAAIDLLTTSTVGDIPEALHEAAYSFFLQTINQKKKEDVLKIVKLFDGHLATIIRPYLKIPLEEVKARLSIAKEFTLLREPSKHIATVFYLEKGQKITVFHAELAETRLTEKLKEEYQNRAIRTWYKILPDWIKKLVDLYTPIILEENRVIPTQLREILINLRNFYQLILIVQHESKPKVLLSGIYHSGTIAYLGKNPAENKRIGVLHGEQLKELTNSQDILAVTLNTAINILGNDKKILDDSAYIIGVLEGHYANLPLNSVRVFAANNNSGIEELLKIVNKVIVSDLREQLRLLSQDSYTEFLNKLNGYLCEGKQENLEYYRQNLDEIVKILISKKSDDFSKQIDLDRKLRILKLSLEIRYLISNNKVPYDPNNRNLKIGASLNLLVSQLRYYYKIAINSSCESGKDRTGILMLYTVLICCMDLLYNNYELTAAQPEQQEQILKNARNIVNAGHYPLLAGMQTALTRGVKDDSKGALPSDEFPPQLVNALIQDPASYNKELPFDDSVQRFYFPSARISLDKQKQELIQSLTLYNTELEAITPVNGFAIPGVLNSGNILRGTSVILKQLMNSISTAHSFQDISNVLSGSKHQIINLYKGTVYTVGEAATLLDILKNNIDELIQLSREKVQSPAQLS